MLPDDCKPHHAAAASPAVFELGGRTFVLAPVTGPDMLAVHAEFRRQCLATSRDPLDLLNERMAAAAKAGKPFDPSVVDALVRSAMSSAGRAEGRAEPSDADILARLNTLDGSRYLVWHRLRRCDPTVTREWVAEHVPDMAARNEVFARLMEIDGMAHLDPKKAAATG